MIMMSALILNQHTELDFHSASSLVDMPFDYRTHYSDTMPTRLHSFSLVLRAQRRSNKYQFIVFGLTRLVLEPTIDRTRFEHVNHYNTNTVVFHICIIPFVSSCISFKDLLESIQCFKKLTSFMFIARAPNKYFQLSILEQYISL